MKRNTLLYVYLLSASTGNVRRDLQTYKDLNGGPEPTDSGGVCFGAVKPHCLWGKGFQIICVDLLSVSTT